MTYKLLVGTASYTFLSLHPTSPVPASHICTLSFSPSSPTPLSSNSSSSLLKQTSTYPSAGPNPSFLAVRRSSLPSASAVNGNESKTLLVAVNETLDGEGRVSTFVLEKEEGVIEYKVGECKSTAVAPCYVSLSHDGKYVLVTNYFGNASTCSLSLSPSTGQLSSLPISSLTFSDASNHLPERQASPHAHCILQHPTQHELVYSADLGADKIRLFRLTDDGVLLHLKDYQCPLGSGPRQLAFHPTEPIVYCLYELSCQISAFNISLPSGDLEHLHTASIAPTDKPKANSSSEGSNGGENEFQSLSGAGVRVSPDGNFLYASTRNDFSNPAGDCITVLSLSSLSSTSISLQRHLTPIQYARPPSQHAGHHIRDLSISPDGRYLACGTMSAGGKVLVFERDAKTGKLSFIEGLELRSEKGEVLSPACFLWL